MADAPPPFHARHFATLTTHVQRELERRILAGEIRAGEKLSETALADSLGVSRGPVREAMRWLAHVGLVDSVANKGAVVRRIGAEEVLDLYDLRGAVFALACETLARRRNDDHLRRLRQSLEDQEAARRDDDIEGYYRLNVAFHALILELCGNRRAEAVYQGIAKEMHLFRRRGLSRVPNIAASLSEHRAIVEAIASGDPVPARRAGRAHVESGKARFLKTLQEQDATAESRRAG